MKKLLILPLLVLLSACVQYYYPETAYEDGVYYAEDDPAYVVFQGGYDGATYYPWYSLDYFYLGYNPYPFYPYYYGFGWGFAYGYSPWDYPFTRHGYYSPLYASYYHYPFYPVWRPYYGYCWNHHACGHRRGSPGDHEGRFAGNRKDSQPVIVDEDVTGEAPIARKLENLKAPGNGRRTFYNSYDSSMPHGSPGNRAMVIRSNENTKIGKSMIQPIEPGPNAGNIRITNSPPALLAPPPRAAGRPPASAAQQRPSYRPASRFPDSSSMPSSRPSPGVNSRSRPGFSAPRSRPSRTVKSRPAPDLD